MFESTLSEIMHRLWDFAPQAAAAYNGARAAAPSCPACEPVLHCPTPGAVYCSEVHCHCGANGTGSHVQAAPCPPPTVCSAAGWGFISVLEIAGPFLVIGFGLGCCVGAALGRRRPQAEPRQLPPALLEGGASGHPVSSTRPHRKAGGTALLSLPGAYFPDSGSGHPDTTAQPPRTSRNTEPAVPSPSADEQEIAWKPRRR